MHTRFNQRLTKINQMLVYKYMARGAVWPSIGFCEIFENLWMEKLIFRIFFGKRTFFITSFRDGSCLIARGNAVN